MICVTKLTSIGTCERVLSLCIVVQEGTLMMMMMMMMMMMYIVSHKKTCHFILDHNSHVSFAWIFALFVSKETGMNTLERSYKVYNFTLTVSPHYLIKRKPRKTALFEVSRHSILLLNSKNDSMR